MSRQIAPLIWDWCRGPKNKTERQKLWRSLRKSSITATNESFSRFVALCATETWHKKLVATEIGTRIGVIPLAARQLIARYGKVYHPRTFLKKWQVEPSDNACFANSALLMRLQNKKRKTRNRLVYVEGLIAGPLAPPMLHAWNSIELDGDQAIDWTHYPSCQWNRYFGIAFTQTEHAEIEKAVCGEGEVLSMFHEELFPYTEPTIVDILRKRQPHPET